MDTTDGAELNRMHSSTTSAEEQLSEVFGSYKAEWLKDRLFEFFTAPDYLPELTTARPCVLVGGRGTGKTTVLRGLSYEGQFALSGQSAKTMGAWKYYGLYLRVNTNRVTAFTGPEVDEDTWVKLFGHYINLLLCGAVLRFLGWYRLYSDSDFELPASKCLDVSTSLHIAPSKTIRELAESLNSARLGFEAYINNVADGPRPPLSMQGAPVDALFEALCGTTTFFNKMFFFLIDEYENFEDYQQQVVNTLIKHSGNQYTFKVGVRELGWRVRTTLNPNERLNSPADYVKIDIAEKLEGDTFRRFAISVCNARLNRLILPGAVALGSIEKILPNITEDEEATLLGVEDAVLKLKQSLKGKPTLQIAETLSPLQLWVAKFWADSQHDAFERILLNFSENQQKWADRFNNYKHASLYSIRKGKRGITKYYAGFDTFAQLAAGNIRYLIELVDQSLLLQLRSDESLSRPISPDIQTRAAQNVGKKNLGELEGLSVHGAQLTKLVLGLGRVFQVMAAQPEGHAPEVNQFHVAESSDTVELEQIESLIKSAVMHLALLRSPGNKLADEGETKEYDYMIHPIFAAFFVFSFRRKRKMLLSPSDLIGLVRNPREYIPKVLARQNRTNDEELPEQVELFEGYYGRRS